VDVRLAVSRDGRSYSWVSYDALIEHGRKGAWDAGGIYAQPELVTLPDGRLALPYSADNTTHNEVWFQTFYGDYDIRSGVGWACWPDGRLAGIEAEEEGEFTTHAARVTGSRLQLNARTSPGGRIEVELRERGVPLTGRRFSDVEAFQGDRIWADCRWPQTSETESLRGRTLEISFRLKMAKIFGCRWA
jgi:hypothetical protein